MKNKSNSRQYNTTKVKGKTQVKKVKKIKLVVYFIIFQVLFGIATAPIIVYYSPFFTNLRKNIVGTAMSTDSHQFIATLFLSTQQINQIIGSGTASAAISQDLSKVSIEHKDKGIKLKQITGNKFNGYMVIIDDPTRVKVGYSSKLGITGQKTSQIAKENNAIAAINGGGFDDKGNNSTTIWTGNGAVPIGIIISNGKLIFPNPNDLDQQQIYKGVAAIDSKGNLIVGDYTVDQLLNRGVKEALSFGPTLIENSQKTTGFTSQGADPRTAIGQTKDGAILLLTLDGRTGLKAGAELEDVQLVMEQNGAVNAVNLDGGASTTMYYNGKVQNSPSDKSMERPVPTAIYVTN
jgi:exopolysaccharide biosynthesis protein